MILNQDMGMLQQKYYSLFQRCIHSKYLCHFVSRLPKTNLMISFYDVNTFNVLVFKIIINLDRDKNNILRTNEESVSSIILQNVAELSGSKKLVMVLECLCQSDYLLVSNLKKIFQEFDNFPMSWINKTICDFKLLLSHIYK